jgi:predicted phage terminase large subunit-like protein
MGLRPKGCSQVPPITFNPATDLSTCDEVISSWDLSFKDGDANDYCVGLVVARRGAQRIVLEVYRRKAGFPEVQRAIRQQHRDWNPDATLIEEAANGAAIIQTLAAELPGIIAVKPLGGKEARASVMEPRVEAGNWILPEGAEWIDAWIDEFASFPRGKHDDQVDAGSMAEARFIEASDVAAARVLLGMR